MDPRHNEPGGTGPVGMGGAPTSKKSRRKNKRRKDHKRRDTKIPIIGALILAVLGGLILFGALSGNGEPDAVFVVRAKADITAYTALSASDLEAVPMDISTLVPVGVDPATMLITGPSAEETIASMGLNDVDARVLRYPLVAGAVLYRNQVTLASSVYDTYNLSANERIVSIEALPARAAGASLAPGEYVDIVAVSPNYELATTLLEKVPVLYVDLSQNALEGIYSTQVQEPSQGQKDLLPADPFPGIYTLAIPEAYVDQLALLQETAILVIVGRADQDSVRLPLDANGRQETRSTVSVLETFCDPELLPEPSVGEGIPATDGTVVVPVENTIELPEVCVAELLRLQSDIVSSTQDLLVTEPLSPIGAPVTGSGTEEG